MGLSGEPTSAERCGTRAVARPSRSTCASRRRAAGRARGGGRRGRWGQVERFVLLRTIDSLWVEHLTEIDDMRRGIGLRGYAQQDPLNEFRREAFRMYEELRDLIRHGVASTIFRVTVQKQPPPDEGLAGSLARVPRPWPARTATAEARRSRRWPVPRPVRRPGREREPPPSLPRRRARRSATSRPRSGTSRSRADRHWFGDARWGARDTPDRGADRPQRPMLVRFGRQVQEVPRPLIG